MDELFDHCLPDFLVQDQCVSILNHLSRRLDRLDLSSVLIYMIDTVEKTALPYLVDQFHIKGYEGEKTIGKGSNWVAIKDDAYARLIVKAMIRIHTRKGTLWALQMLLRWFCNVHYAEVKIYEWFEYAGQPYHFKIDVNFRRGFSVYVLNDLIELINEHTNVRSYLECLKLKYKQHQHAPASAIKTIYGENTMLFPLSKRAL